MSNKKDPKLVKAGVSGYNKPKRTPNHPTQPHDVVDNEGDTPKTTSNVQHAIRGGGKAPKYGTHKDRRTRRNYRPAQNSA